MEKLSLDKSTLDAFRQFVQDCLAPELRGIKATQEAHGSAIAELRMDIREVRAEMKAGFAELRSEMRTGFERLDRRMETYDDIQKLKVEMAEIRGERRARQAEPAA